MSSAVYIPTRRGLLPWLGRRFELLQIAATLRWAEEDRARLAHELTALPKRLRQLDRDVDQLRVRQAVLRGTR